MDEEVANETQSGRDVVAPRTAVGATMHLRRLEVRATLAAGGAVGS
jgi:hypothetical protein